MGLFDKIVDGTGVRTREAFCEASQCPFETYGAYKLERRASTTTLEETARSLAATWAWIRPPWSRPWPDSCEKQGHDAKSWQ